MKNVLEVKNPLVEYIKNMWEVPTLFDIYFEDNGGCFKEHPKTLLTMSELFNSSGFPFVDVTDVSNETRKAIHIEMAIAGWNKNDIFNITIENSVLKVTGEKTCNTGNKTSYTSKICNKQNFTWSYPVPKQSKFCDKAVIKDGILSFDVLIPAPPSAEVKTLTVE